MKSFAQILTESKKTYEFKIGVAGELPEGFQDHMETALQKFKLLNSSAGKKTPIQERPLDFPQLQNMEVTYFEVETEYPTTVQILQEYLGQCCGIPQSHIIVRNPNEPQELYQEAQEDEVYEPMLTKEDMGGESGQEHVGGERIMGLLAELEKARKEGAVPDGADAAPDGETAKQMDDSENTKAVLGS
jgi:hypothetical protein